MYVLCTMFPLAGQTAGQYVLKFFLWTLMDYSLGLTQTNKFRFFSKLVFIIKQDIRIYVSKRLDRMSGIFLWTLIFLFIFSSISPPPGQRWSYQLVDIYQLYKLLADLRYRGNEVSGEKRAAISSSFLLRLGMKKYLCELDNAAL